MLKTFEGGFCIEKHPSVKVTLVGIHVLFFGNYTGTATCVGRKVTEMVRKFRHMLMSVVKCIPFLLCLIIDVHITYIILCHAEAPLEGEMATATVPENSTALLWYVQTTQSKWMMVLCKSSTFKFS